MSIDAEKSEVEMFHICLLFGLLVTFWILRNLWDKFVDNANNIQIRRNMKLILIT